MVMQPIMLCGLLVLALSTNISSINYFNHKIAYNQYALIGILAFFTTTQMSQAMYRATVDKQYGLLAIKFLNNVQPWHYLTGMSFFPSIGWFYYFMTLPLGLIILEFWSSLGILLSTKIATYEKRDLIMTLIFTPISYAAPMLYALSHHAPWILKALTSINPLTYQLKTLRSIAYGNFDIISISIGVGVTIAMIIIMQIILKCMQLTLSER